MVSVQFMEVVVTEKTVSKNISLPQSMVDAVQRIAEANSISFTAQVRLALIALIKKEGRDG